MKILAIESSAVTASVAILSDEELIAEYTINYKKTHSQTLLPMINEMCSMTETTVDMFDLIAVSIGPGSFTGLRIGAATGKGIALAAHKKMAAVPTLEAMAYNLYGTDMLVCPIMDAKRKHLYTGIYEFSSDGKLRTVKNQSLLSFEELAEILNGYGRKVIFTGDGIAVAKQVLSEKLSCEYTFAPPHMGSQRAASVAAVALQMYEEGKILDAGELKPDYLRPSQAERERMEKNQ